MKSKLFEITDDMPAPYMDPFEVEAFDNSSIHIRKWDGTLEHSGSIEFKKGQTEGTQRFEAGSFDALMAKMRAFMEAL